MAKGSSKKEDQEVKFIYSYRTTPTIHDKADKKASKEDETLSNVIHKFLIHYTRVMRKYKKK